MKKVLVVLAVAVFVLTASVVMAGSIVNTKHDLSTGSTSGGYVNGSAIEVCAFCHTPHGSEATYPQTAPLWNKSTTGSSFQVYTSATLNATPGQPTGASLACMTCHDGTLAVTAVLNQPNSGATSLGAAVGGVDATGKITSGGGALGTDLRNDHPVSFTYNAALVTADQGSRPAAQLRAPGALANGARLIGTQVECASCHNVHDNANVPFMNGTMNGSLLCLGCHIK